MPRGASLTAEWVCLLRALEQARPASDRVVDDPLAARFLRPSLYAALRLATIRTPLRVAPLDWGALPAGPAADFVAARHRYIDDALVAALAAGVTQVVVLGAGYDTRAWRCADTLGDRLVWEVDFPATQARKRQILGWQPDLSVDRVRFVPVDFSHQDFGDRLVSQGFPVGESTLFVWEGVSMYLDRATVGHTLDTLRQLGGPGSRLVADFWQRPRGGPWGALSTAGARLFGVIGEPLRFALRQDAAPAFLLDHGFALDELLDAATLAERYRGRRGLFYAPLFVARASAA